MNGRPTAAQKRWHEYLRGRGCVVSNIPHSGSIHHINGSKMKLKGCVNPGEWYVIPLSYWWHQDPRNPNAVHTNRKAFERKTGTTEKKLFEMVVKQYFFETGEYPMLEHEFDIIMERA